MVSKRKRNLHATGNFTGKSKSRLSRASIAGYILTLGMGIVYTGCDSNSVSVEDVIAPTVTLSSPALTEQGYTVVNGTQTVIRGSAIDDIAVTRLAYQLNDGDEQEIAIVAGNTVEFEFTVPLEPGTNVIITNAYDATGNTAAVERVIASTVVRYEVIVAGEPDDGMMSRPQAINAAGDVALQWDPIDHSQTTRGYIWSAGALTGLGITEGLEMRTIDHIAGINSSRVVVGYLSDVDAQGNGIEELPVIWENGQPHLLPLPSGWDGGTAMAVNDAGTIVGNVAEGSRLNANRSMVLWQGGEPILIGEAGMASDINNIGVVTGSSQGKSFRWEQGQITILEPLYGRDWSTGIAINDEGVIVGISGNSGLDQSQFESRRLATMWRGTTVISLGEFPHGHKYSPLDINNHGQTVGSVNFFGRNDPKAFISEDGRMSILNHLTNGEWNIIEAIGINDAGQIAARAHRLETDLLLSVIVQPIAATQ